MYAVTTSRPNWLTSWRSSAAPFSLAAIWARRSARLAPGFRDGNSAEVSSSVVADSRISPPPASRQLSMSTPSSSTRVLKAGIEPGVMPPISA